MKLKLLVILTLTMGCAVANAAGKSAFINPAILMEKSVQAKNAATTMQNEFKDRENSLRNMASEINTLEKTYQKDSAIMSEEQRKKSEQDIVQRKRKFQFDQQSLKEDLQKRRSQLIQEIQRSISTVIQAYGKKNGYDFIFTEGVVYASDSVNITDEILKELEK